MKYLKFDHESSRSEFWAIHLLVYIGTWLAMGLLLVTATLISYLDTLLGGFLVILSILVPSVFAVWLSLAVSARRCLEAGISRLWAIPTLIPFFGFIVVIVLGCIGPDPDRIRIKINE